MNNPVVDIKGLKNYLGGHWVHEDVNLTINRGEIIAIVGGSGSGKTTILRSIIMLQKPTAGDIKVLDVDVQRCSLTEAKLLRQRWGMMFQRSALFSSLSILENVMFPLNEFTNLSDQMQREVALLKIALVGLPIDAAYKSPAELSGGMQKRAACARALALDPELLFLDEPTAGLDPQSAEALDNLIIKLRDNLNLTITLVTHDLDTLWTVTDRVAFLGEGKVLACEPMGQLVQNSNPIIQKYFSGTRGQRFIKQA